MKQFYYLIHIQYLGFRFHGWQKQPKHKTVHLMIDKTVKFVLGDRPFKTLGTSRTDARVSAEHSAFELFLDEPIDQAWFLAAFNSNLPSDIRALSIEEVNEKFNIINTAKTKEYFYLFTFGEKPHPFAASIMTYFKGKLALEKMQEGAKIFEGKHNFKRYCTKPAEHTNLIREIIHCSIEQNSIYTANFFPNESYILKIQSKGFLRYQVRLIMAELVNLGRGKTTIDKIKDHLKGIEPVELMETIAPGSGLILNEIKFDK